VDGVLWARQWNGKEIKVYNKAFIAADFDTRVLVGKDRNQRSKWYILQGLEDYLVPASGGRLAYHAAQHMFGAPDVLWLDRKQLLAFTLIVSNGPTWKLYLYGGLFHSLTTITLVPSQELDLSAYVATTGAYYLSIVVDDAGTISYIAGSNFGAPVAGGPSYVAPPPSGKYLIGYVIFYEGQTQLADDDVRVIMPLGVVPKTQGLQIHEADADTPLDADEFGFWDVVDGITKKITLGNLKTVFKSYFDTIYAAISHTHAATDVTGQYRRLVLTSDGSGGWKIVSSGIAPVETLADLE
jgi:hypothetical protein